MDSNILASDHYQTESPLLKDILDLGEDGTAINGTSARHGTAKPDKVNYGNDKPVRTKQFVQKHHDGSLLAEAVIIAGKAYFAVAAPKAGNEDETFIVLQETIPIGESTLLFPPDLSSYMNKPYVFKSQEEFEELVERTKHETLDTLDYKVRSIWKKYIDANDFHISICAADTIFTYYQDKMGSTHYLFFIGNNDSGKSNNLSVLHLLAYRNVTSTDMTAANIYQVLGNTDEGQATICEDEADNIDDNPEKMRIYKNGYTIGFPVLRTDTSYGRKQYKFNTFCFKAFAAERLPDSKKAKGFNQRIIELTCIHGSPQYDISEITSPAGDDEYQGLLEELTVTRNMLLIYRLIHFKDKIPNTKLNINNREKQLFKPLIRLFCNTETQKKLLPVISNYISQKRERNSNTLHAFLYSIIKALTKEQNSMVIESDAIWATVKDTLHGKDIPNKPQSYDTVEFGVISQKEIVQVFKDIFHAKKSKRHGEARKLVFDIHILERLGKTYDVPDEVEVLTEQGGGTGGTLGTVVGLGRYTFEAEITKESASNSSYDTVEGFTSGKIIDTSTNGCNVSQLSQESPPQEIGSLIQVNSKSEATELSQPSQGFSGVDHTPDNKKRYECYYCDKLGTDDDELYNKHGVLVHPGKPAYPSKTDLEKYGLDPQDKPWEI